MTEVQKARSENASAYPLTWPRGWKRTSIRKDGQFKKDGNRIGVGRAVDRVLLELDRMGFKEQNVIISTNLQPRLNGLPRADQANPGDPGVAVYFRKKSSDGYRCIAIDAYWKVADNLAAIAATLEAMRAIERHGGGEILDRAFTGFAALPAATEGESWWSILAIDAMATAEQIDAAYRKLARTAHPDLGGSDAAIRRLNIARDQAQAAANGRS